MRGSCMKILEPLRILLASVSLSELMDYAPKIDIDRIYKCLATSNKYCHYLWHQSFSLPILFNTKLDVFIFFHRSNGFKFQRILDAIPVGHALGRYEDLFLQGLAHPENRVKELIFQEV